MIPFFTYDELKCKGSGLVRLDPRFADGLVDLRRTVGYPLDPSSVCRNPAHNRKVRGHKRSLHLTEPYHDKLDGTCAADLKWRSWNTAKKLAFCKVAWAKGWSIGLHVAFVHIDMRILAGLRQHIFLYGRWEGAFNASDIRG